MSVQKNKLTTLGYFKKRLRDSGYIVLDIYKTYSFTDPRSWTIMIDPGGASVLCTCYKNTEAPGEDYFEVYDGGQFIRPGRVIIKTSSIEVFITHLVRYNINSKTPAMSAGLLDPCDNDDDNE